VKAHERLAHSADRIPGGHSAKHGFAVEDGYGRHSGRTIPWSTVVNRRPKLTMVAPSASEEEAAAVVAALERFMRDTAPPSDVEQVRSPWQEAALHEGVSRSPEAPVPWA
jgi:hypothetical protein